MPMAVFAASHQQEDQFSKRANGNQKAGNDEKNQIEKREQIFQYNPLHRLGGGLRRGVDLTGLDRALTWDAVRPRGLWPAGWCNDGIRTPPISGRFLMRKTGGPGA